MEASATGGPRRGLRVVIGGVAALLVVVSLVLVASWQHDGSRLHAEPSADLQLPDPPACTADTIAEALIAYGQGRIRREDAIAAAGSESHEQMSDFLDYVDEELADDPTTDIGLLLGNGRYLAGYCA